MTDAEFELAERVLRHVGAQALEGLPDVDWSVERHPTLVRLRFSIKAGAASILFKTETDSKRLEMELVSRGGQRIVNLTLLLERFDALAGLRSIVRVHESGLDSASVDFELSALAATDAS